MVFDFRAVFYGLLLTGLIFTACVSVPKKDTVSMRRYSLDAPPFVLRDGVETKIPLGGFSGLIYEGVDSKTGELKFLTHTDRGPNAPLKKSKKGEVAFAIPDYQPEWVWLSLNTKTNILRVTGRKGLNSLKGSPLSGRPNRVGIDETPVDESGKKIALDPLGLDLEAIVRMPDGSYWMGEEYRPSLLHFSADGRLLKRLVPMGAVVKMDGFTETESLPQSFSRRKRNRGFEGLALQGTKIIGFLQSSFQGDSRVVRVVEYDTVEGRTTGEYIYLFHDAQKDWKIGDVAALPDGSILVLEQTSEIGKEAERKIYRARLSEATNILTPPISSDEDLESLDESRLAARGIRAMPKIEIVDLAALGYNFVSKVEGLSVLDRRTLALINDEDFGLRGEKTELVLVDLNQDLF